MRVLKHLFDNNRAWAEGITRDDPDFFQRLARQQAPRYLWTRSLTVSCAISVCASPARKI
jgi:carbonic anhydrase